MAFSTTCPPTVLSLIAIITSPAWAPVNWQFHSADLVHLPACRGGRAYLRGRQDANSTTYNGWFGFDSIPVMNKSNPAVRRTFSRGQIVSRRMWLSHGITGWRMDVMGDFSFPDGYWEEFPLGCAKTADWIRGHNRRTLAERTARCCASCVAIGPIPP